MLKQRSQLTLPVPKDRVGDGWFGSRWAILERRCQIKRWLRKLGLKAGPAIHVPI